MTELSSKTISAIRFPLIIGVVLIHNSMNNILVDGKSVVDIASMPILNNIQKLIGDIICQAAVPLFFLLSGYLFFTSKSSDNASVAKFNKETYLHKLKSRVHSLLVPYIIWNALMLIIYIVAEQCLGLGGLQSGRFKSTTDFTILDYLSVFWNIRGGMPILYQFWFLRDLIVMCIAAPLLYILIRYTREAFLLLLFILWYNSIGFVVCPVSIFFFSLGAYFSIFKHDMIEKYSKCAPMIYWFYPLLVAHDLYTGEYYIHISSIIAGIIFFVSVIRTFIEKKFIKVNKFLLGSTFFIYALHEPYMSLIRKVLFKALNLHNEIGMIALYFICPIIIVLALLGIYTIAIRICPKLIGIITGGR